jgi:germination protein M
VRFKWFYVGLLFVLLLTGCSDKAGEVPARGQSYMYYLNMEETKLVSEVHSFGGNNSEEEIEERIKLLKKEPDQSDQKMLLPKELVILRWEQKEDVLWFDFDRTYLELDITKEILVRAGVVQMFTQVDSVSYVGFLIEGKEYVDQQGDPVGMMNGDSFVEYSGKEINAYQYITMDLYFSDARGRELKKEERNVYYSKNTPLEQVVIEQLVKGPKGEDCYPTIPAETRILSVTTVDGIAYVNLSSAFLQTTLPVQPKVVIQSIVRSLLESSDIIKVQIAVNGDTKVEFMDSINLDQFFKEGDL